MDELRDLHDWELLRSSDSPHKPMKELGSPRLGYESDAGAVKHDYFTLDSGSKYAKRSQSEDAESPYHSDNPSWIDPETFPMNQNQPREFWSDESIYTEQREIGHLSGERENPSDLESETRDLIEKNGGKEIERRWHAWWKFPFEIIRDCVLRIRPVWSLSVATAILGIVILGRKFLRLQEQYQTRNLMPLKIILDEKRISQIKAHVGRLNEAFSMVKRVPLIRASFPTDAVAPSPILGLYTE